MTGTSELAIQTKFRSRARILCPAVAIVAIPNAAKRGQKALNQARREGAAWGFPDMLCFWRGGHVAAIEFKSASGKLSDNQTEWLDRLNGMGIPATVVRDPDAAIDFLRRAGAPFISAAPADAVATMRTLPPHLTALQLLVGRCPSQATKKSLIVTAGLSGAISGDEAFTIITANQLEVA